MRRGERRPLSERFSVKVDRSGGPDACWPWQGARGDYGHGQISSGGKHGRLLQAHRVAWELEHGPIPDGLKILHECDNPPCCNPRHLFLGTQADNMADMARKGRWSANGPRRALRGEEHPLRRNPAAAARGERVGGAKLTEELVRMIRSSRRSQRDLARELGVDRRTISFIRQGKTWRHVVGVEGVS